MPLVEIVASVLRRIATAVAITLPLWIVTQDAVARAMLSSAAELVRLVGEDARYRGGKQVMVVVSGVAATPIYLKVDVWSHVNLLLLPVLVAALGSGTARRRLLACAAGLPLLFALDVLHVALSLWLSARQVRGPILTNPHLEAAATYALIVFPVYLLPVVVWWIVSRGARSGVAWASHAESR